MATANEHPDPTASAAADSPDAGARAGTAAGAGTGARADPGTGPGPGAAGSSEPGTTAGAGPGGRKEFRAAELAEAAGITSRTLRFYRERKLLPPPRREGRIAWYDEHHLARLRTISALLARGHTLGGIADLLATFEKGRGSGSTPAELLGLGPAFTTPFSEETPVRLTPEELADHFQGEVTVDNLAASLDIGYVAVDGDEFVHVSQRLLDASAELVAKGIPLSAVLAAGRRLRDHTDTIAALFAEMFRTHLLPGRADGDTTDTDQLAEMLERVSPIAKAVVEAELGLALDRHVRAELERWLSGAKEKDASE